MSERRERWREREAKRPPGEVAAYGLSSIAGMLVFGVWLGIAPGVFPSVAFSASGVVFAAAVVFEWKWKDLNGE